ncbi:MAG: NUDIX domain-containing protein [Acidobacteria bacterium]|nr:NUDIX domain-containing protein [Acidobacteriota bacterium]
MIETLVGQVAGIPALDAVGEAHRAEALAWLRGTDDVYRRVKPAIPDPHLVAYVLVVDRAAPAVLLCDHRLAGLWLPTGGHVDRGESPQASAARECREELGAVLPSDAATGAQPFFVTVTETTGPPADRHMDVSLWFAFAGTRGMRLQPDPREFRAVRWWTPDELATAAPDGFEPHLGRALGALRLRRARGQEPGRSTGTIGRILPAEGDASC